MTTEEFSNEFDVLYNNITSNQAPGLDEYEKSVFLTRAQDDIVKRYFTPKGNKDLEGFDTSIKRNVDFSSLYRTLKLNSVLAYNWDFTLYKSSIRVVMEGIGKNKVSNNSELKTNFVNNISSYTYTIFKNTSNEITDIICWVCLSKPDVKEILKVFPLKESDYTVTGTPNGFHIEKDFFSQFTDEVLNNPKKYPDLFDTILLASRNAQNFIDSLAQDSVFHENSQFNITNITIKNRTEFPLNPDKENPIFLPINDSLLVQDGNLESERLLQIVNISTVEYMRLMLKPFKQPLKNQAWKLQTNVIDNCASIELIFGNNNTFKEYTLRYLTRPTPIILTDLSKDLSINGKRKASTCLLNEELHPEILQRAVELAKVAYLGDLSSTLQIGSMSSTNLGQVAQQQSK